MSDSLWPPWTAASQAYLPSPTPGACSNSCPSSQWCHPTISPSVVSFSSFPSSVFPSIRVFSSVSVLHIRWPKYWSFNFSISPSNEYSGLISFRTDWFDPLAVQGMLPASQLVFSSTLYLPWCCFYSLPPHFPCVAPSTATAKMTS